MKPTIKNKQKLAKKDEGRRKKEETFHQAPGLMTNRGGGHCPRKDESLHRSYQRGRNRTSKVMGQLTRDSSCKSERTWHCERNWLRWKPCHHWLRPWSQPDYEYALGHLYRFSRCVLGFGYGWQGFSWHQFPPCLQHGRVEWIVVHSSEFQPSMVSN